MKKVINITLGSIVFAIDEDAYAALASYIEQIKNNLKNSDDIKEIIDDIEIAIAEKFIARNRSEKMAVTVADVEAVIGEMGSPVEFGAGEDDDTNTHQTAMPQEPEAEPKKKLYRDKDNAVVAGVASGLANYFGIYSILVRLLFVVSFFLDGLGLVVYIILWLVVPVAETEPTKKLYRDKDNAVVAGVASGLANYFGIDPVIVRLLFVISIFLNGLGLLVYIILWLVVSVAETTADKYAMRGERVTLKDISDRVKKDLNHIEKFDYEKNKGTWSFVRNFLDKLFRISGTIIVFVVLVLRYVVGIAVIIVGALGIAGVVSAYSALLLSEKSLFPSEVEIVLETLLSSTLGIVAVVSSFIVITIPLIVLIVAGASLLAKRSFFTVQKSVSLGVIWIVATVLAGTLGALQVEQVKPLLGPIEGRFDDNSFEVIWENGAIYGDHRSGHFIYEDRREVNPE